jgi:hypothetical protein
MRRSSGDASGPLRPRPRPGAVPRDPVARALHHLGNNINSLALRLYVLQQSDLGAEAKSHLDAAHRLTQQSMRVIEEIYAMLAEERPAIRPPVASRPGATARRNPRK